VVEMRTSRLLATYSWLDKRRNTEVHEEYEELKVINEEIYYM